MTDVPRFSQLLTRVVAEHPADRIGPADLIAAIGDRTLGALLLLFALPNLLPLPPGVSMLTGTPLILISAQMLMGRAQPWLPRWIMRRSIAKAQAVSGLARLLRYERWIERLIRPRLPVLTGHRAAQAIGAVALVLSLIAWLPIPLLHYAPALVLALFGLAIVNRDGVLAIVALIASVLAFAFLGEVVVVGTRAILYLAERFLGV